MRLVLRTLLSLSLLLPLTSPAWAAGQHGNPHDIRAAVEAGGDRLVALQNGDGGWFFVVGDTDCGAGPGVSCPNTFGVTALGLLASYRVTHDRDHLAAAQRTADALVAAHAAAPACDGNAATSADRPFTVDVSFLLDGFGRAHGPAGAAYRDTARAWFRCVTLDFSSGAARADNRIDGRIAQGLDNLGAWDASLDIRAALAVGERDYALAEAREVIARAGDWDVDDPDCPGCQLLAKGLFLAATADLRSAPDIRDARAQWLADLVAAQSPDGSWGGDTQTTAYALLGLATVPQSHHIGVTERAAAAFLLSVRTPDGGFLASAAGPDEVTEVDGEVLQGLQAFLQHD